MKITLKTRGLGLDGVQFLWDVDLAHDEVLSLARFFVEVSESNSGPWIAVNTDPIINAFGYIDRKAYRGGVAKRICYRVRAINAANDEEFASNVAVLGEQPISGIGRMIAKNQRLLLQRLIGDRTLHYARKHFGKRCECYDEVMKKQIISPCRKCYNTTFVGGYYCPNLIYISRGPTNRTAEPTQFGSQENTMTESWTSNYAPVDVEDLLITSNEQRYIVKRVQATSVQNATIKQALALQRVKPNDPEMMVPAFSAPVNLEDADVFRRDWGE